MGVYETIISRRTIRKFSQDEIKQEILVRLINAGRLAPSAANLQPLQYFVINNKGLKEKIFPNLTWAGYINPEGNPKKGERPVTYIIILADKSMNKSPELDVGASAMSISLAAHEVGIGCCWVLAFKKKQVNEMIIIPDGISAEMIIALGYPVEKPVAEDIGKGRPIKYYKDSLGTLHVPKRKLEDIAHFNKF